MKIFISWSGETSHKVAKIFRDWLPSVIQSVKPYVSSEDIDKGSRWSTDIASELEESSYGILCVTKENLNAPWLNFEAGALGKSVDKSRVSPFLFRVKRSEVTGPLLQFQSTILEKDDIFKLVKSINETCEEHGLDEARLEKVFEVWWPSLIEELNSIEENTPNTKTPQPSKTNNNETEYLSNVLEEILEISRINQKLLRDPEQILPMNYFEHIQKQITKRSRSSHLINGFHPKALADAIDRYRELIKAVSEAKEKLPDSEEINKISKILSLMEIPMTHIIRRTDIGFEKDF